jgi:hypothetical protein
MEDHGTNAGYTRGCKCDACKAAHATYQREYVARNKAKIAAQRSARWRDRSPEQAAARRAWYNEYQRTNAEQRDKRNERRRGWREDPEYRKREREQLYIAWKRNPGKRALIDRKAMLKKQYGLTLEQFDEMLEAQDGACALCGREQVGMRLHVDHCHASGVVRGLLCSNCNTGLGMFGDDPDRLIAAIQYIEAAKEKS